MFSIHLSSPKRLFYIEKDSYRPEIETDIFLAVAVFLPIVKSQWVLYVRYISGKNTALSN